MSIKFGLEGWHFIVAGPYHKNHDMLSIAYKYKNYNYFEAH